MAVGFPAKTNFATGDVLTATNMNDVTGTLNLLESAQYAAGKNKIINGDFRINQRAFTSVTTTGVFTFDRWKTALSGGTVTYTPQTFTLGAAPVVGYEGSTYLQTVTSGQSAAGDFAQIVQPIESVRTFAGQTVTMSFWAKAATGTPKIATEFSQWFGSGGSPSSQVNTYGGQVTLSTSWARYSVTVAIPSISGKTLGTDNADRLEPKLWFSAGSTFDSRTGTLGIQNNTFSIWGFQVEAGSTSSPFQTASGSIAGELALCQRYYYRTTQNANVILSQYGTATTTTQALCPIALPETMRVTPTSLDFSSIYLSDSVNAFTGVSGVTLGTTSNSIAEPSVTINVGTLTQFRGYKIVALTNGGYVGFSAEL